MTAPASVVRVPLFVTREATAELINAQLPALLFEAADLGGYGVEVRVLRDGPIRLAFEDLDGGSHGLPYAPRPRIALAFAVPIRADLRRPTLLADLRAEGELVARFRTELTVEPDWALSSRTELVDYDWTRAPLLKLGGLQFPVEGLTASLLGRLKSTIAAGVDEGIAANASLRPALTAVLQQLAQPVSLGEEYGGFLVSAPDSVGLGRLRERSGGLATELQFILQPSVTLAAVAPAPHPVRLPDNTGVTADDGDFEMAIRGSFAFADMRRVLAKALLDTTLEASGRRATVREVDIYGQHDRLVVGLRMEGDYRGWAYVTARPTYSEAKGKVRLTDLELRLDTRNLLHRAVASLFKKRIRALLDEQFGQQLDAQLEGIRAAIASKVDGTEVVRGVRLDGEAARLSLDQVAVTAEGLQALVNFRGTLQVTVTSLAF